MLLTVPLVSITAQSPAARFPSTPVFFVAGKGYEESSLPAGSIVFFQEVTFWERYRWQVSGVAALLLLQTILIAGLLWQRGKLWRAHKDFVESQERNRAILLAIPDLMFLQSADGVYLDYHAKDSQALLVRPEIFLGKNMSQILPAHLASELQGRFQLALATGETQVLEYELSRGDQKHWFEARIAPCSQQKILSVVRDITERKRSAEALTNSEEFNRRIVESTSDCVKVLDLEGNLIYMNEQGQRLLEIDNLNYLLNTSWIDLWSGEERVNASTAVTNARNGEIGFFEGFGKTMKGTERSWNTVITPMRGTRGNVERLLAISRDITEQKAAMKTIRESEERFAKAFDANPQPMALTALADGRFLHLNKSFVAMSGYERNELIGHTSTELGLYETPDLRGLVEPLLNQGKNLNFELRFRTKSGAVKVLLSSAELLELSGQKCILLASSDISERKALEEELRLSEREFSTLVQNSPDIISRLDRDLRYIYVSPALERITGIAPERFIGKTPTQVKLQGYDDEGFEESCREAIETKSPVSRAILYGERNYWIRIIPEFSPDDAVESVMTISEDVTDRVRSEQELTELTVRLFNLQDEERRRIARELHDGTAQNLFAISINLAKLDQLDISERVEARQLIAECQSLGDQSLREIRTLSYLLHPPLLDQAGLVSALHWYVEGFSKRSGVYVDLFAQPIGRLASEIEMALFRVVQEALTNVRRHSGSEIARIRLERNLNDVVLEISDQGHGLRGNTIGTDSSTFSMGVGIPGMRQRLRQLGGRLEIVSNDHGTIISAVVPVTNGVNHGSYSSRGRS